MIDPAPGRMAFLSAQMDLIARIAANMLGEAAFPESPPASEAALPPLHPEPVPGAAPTASGMFGPLGGSAAGPEPAERLPPARLAEWRPDGASYPPALSLAGLRAPTENVGADVQRPAPAATADAWRPAPEMTADAWPAPEMTADALQPAPETTAHASSSPAAPLSPTTPEPLFAASPASRPGVPAAPSALAAPVLSRLDTMPDAAADLDGDPPAPRPLPSDPALLRPDDPAAVALGDADAAGPADLRPAETNAPAAAAPAERYEAGPTPERPSVAFADEPVLPAETPARSTQPPQVPVLRHEAARDIDLRFYSDAASSLGMAGGTLEDTGFAAAMIFNAAMIPGWPPPRPFEMPAAQGLTEALLRNLRVTEGTEALLEAVTGQIGSRSLAEALRGILRRLSASRRARLLLGLTMLSATIGAVLDAIEAELLHLVDTRIEDDQTFGDGEHRRQLSA